MKTNILNAVLVLVCAFTLIGSAQQKQPAPPNPRSAAQDSRIVVGPNVQVSKERAGDAHGEIFLAASQTDPKSLVGCSMIASTDEPVFNYTYYRTIVYTSTDGGKTWKSTLDVAPQERRNDPACTFGLDNDVYFSEFVMDVGGPTLFSGNHPRVYRSRDGGLTWLPPTKLPPLFNYLDHPWVTVDRTNSKYRGRAYVHGLFQAINIERSAGVTSIGLAYAIDNDDRFQAAVTQVAKNGETVGTCGNGAVLSDGTLIFPFSVLKQPVGDQGKLSEDIPGASQGWIKVIASTDGGASFRPATTVSDFYCPLETDTAASGPPSFAADPGSASFNDRLYVVWHDMRSSHTNILFSYSADKGRTWSPARVINDDGLRAKGAGPNHFLPVVAVNRDGVVGVMWHDRRNSSDNLGWETRFRASLDGGETFLPSVRVSEAPNSFDKHDQWIVKGSSQKGFSITFNFHLNNFTTIAGHTAGLAADAAGVFHPFWIDNRTGVPQIWTAPVTVNGSVAKNGSAELANLADVSSKVTVQLSKLSYDRSKELLYAHVELKNTSGEALHAPIVLRLLGFKSPLGRPLGNPEVVNADNGLKGEGATWDFSSLTNGGELKPDEMTRVKQLVFRLTDVRPLRQGTQANGELAVFDARVLARVSKTGD